MKQQTRIGVWLIMVLFMAMGNMALPQSPGTERLTDRIRKSLTTLPYYGVFDHLVFDALVV